MNDLRQSAEASAKAIMNVFRKLYGFKSKEKPKSMQDFIEQKKQNEPFYKSNNKKPWE